MILVELAAKLTVKVANDCVDEVEVPGATPMVRTVAAGMLVKVCEALLKLRLSINRLVPA